MSVTSVSESGAALAEGLLEDWINEYIELRIRLRGNYTLEDYCNLMYDKALDLGELAIEYDLPILNRFMAYWDSPTLVLNKVAAETLMRLMDEVWYLFERRDDT